MDSLYVHRPVLNAQRLHDWATAQGIQNLLPPEEMHVTQVFSRAPVKDLEPKDDTIVVKRKLELLGPKKNVLVLSFNSDALQARHVQAMAAGASHDWDGYHPHVTLSYDSGVDHTKLTPPDFPLELGPEVHAPLNENWASDKGLKKDITSSSVHTPTALGNEKEEEELSTVTVVPVTKEAPNPRPVITPKRGAGGLIVEPATSDPTTLMEENHARERFAKKANYADPYVGEGRTYDTEGRYNCGACNQADGKSCLFWKIDNLDLEAGSCRSWENECAGDPEMKLRLLDGGAASYGVAANGVGFGCTRCPFSAKSARGPDSFGRALWCGEGGFRVFDNACCEFNGAALANTTNPTTFRVAKVDDSLGLVFGWAIVCKVKGEDYYDLNVDLAGQHAGERVPEHIPEMVMAKAALDITKNGAMPGNEMHSGPDTGHYPFLFPLTTDIAKAMGITTDKTGLMCAFAPPPGVLSKFKPGPNGEAPLYTGFSIEGKRLSYEEHD